MKRLDCPLGEGCHATIEVETEEELMEKAQAHAAEKHPEVELDEATIKEIKSKIQTV